MKTATQKQVKVINRYEFKDRNLVVYEVRSSNGVDKYRTTFLDGKFTGCTCPSRQPCYHRIQLQAREDARKLQEQIAAALVPVYVEDIDDPFFHPERDSKPLSREAYQDEFSPCTIPGMY